jgi:hypothetical protein
MIQVSERALPRLKEMQRPDGPRAFRVVLRGFG